MLLQTVVPRLERYAQLLSAEHTTLALLHVRSALLVALGRCMAWNSGQEAAAIATALAGTALEELLPAVTPAPASHI